MKKLVLFLLLAVCSVSAMVGRVQEVVYLKNGSVIRGTIIEQVPNVSLKIQTNDGNIFAYKMSEVAKITKEETSSNRIHSSSSSLLSSFELDGRGPEIGYRGFVDLGCTIGIGKLCEWRIELNTVHGYQFMPYLFAGLGVGVHYYFNPAVSVPIFADIRSDILNNSISPFVEMRVGYSPFKAKGFYFNPSLGCRFTMRGINAINTSIGYSMLRSDYEFASYGYYYSEKATLGGFNIRVGLEF